MYRHLLQEEDTSSDVLLLRCSETVELASIWGDETEGNEIGNCFVLGGNQRRVRHGSLAAPNCMKTSQFRSHRDRWLFLPCGKRERLPMAGTAVIRPPSIPGSLLYSYHES